MARYMMTARRKAALRKAQLASARARKMSRRKKRALSLGVLSFVGYQAASRSPKGKKWRDALGSAKYNRTYERKTGNMTLGFRYMNIFDVYGQALYNYQNSPGPMKNSRKQFKRSVLRTIKKL